MKNSECEEADRKSIPQSQPKTENKTSEISDMTPPLSKVTDHVIIAENTKTGNVLLTALYVKRAFQANII